MLLGLLAYKNFGTQHFQSLVDINLIVRIYDDGGWHGAENYCEERVCE